MNDTPRPKHLDRLSPDAQRKLNAALPVNQTERLSPAAMAKLAAPAVEVSPVRFPSPMSSPSSELGPTLSEAPATTAAHRYLKDLESGRAEVPDVVSDGRVTAPAVVDDGEITGLVDGVNLTHLTSLIETGPMQAAEALSQWRDDLRETAGELQVIRLRLGERSDSVRENQEALNDDRARLARAKEQLLAEMEEFRRERRKAEGKDPRRTPDEVRLDREEDLHKYRLGGGAEGEAKRLEEFKASQAEPPSLAEGVQPPRIFPPPLVGHGEGEG